eukprot:GHRR01001103.1.p1 GENE.GHRR01001103.1~~GHRR01001103.1.p1  ORF type:complete len:461 (+),score=171.15 GHRR01001103.1:185-1567(+)
MPNLLTKSGRAQRKCDACLSSVQATFSSIYVTQERALKLQQVFNQSSDAQASQQMLQIKAVNLSSELEACLLAAGLRSSIKWTVTLNEHTTAETAVPLGSTGAAVVDSNTASTTAAAATGSPIGRAPNSLHSPTVSSCSANISRLSHRGSNSTKGTCNSSSSSSSSKKMAKGKNTQLDSVAVLQASQITPDCNLVLIELTIGSSQLTYAERCIAAFALLSCVPVVFVAAEPCAALDGAAGWVAGKAWGICSSYLELEQRLRGDLVHAVAIRAALLQDIQTLLRPYMQVDKLRHFAKRGAVALVPGGVHAVNALGLVRLAKRVLQATGMASSKHAKKAVASSTAAGGAKVTAIDSISDVYQFIVQGSIVADALTAAAGAADLAAGAAAAADTVTVLDAFTLGTVCVFTGMVSAWGAAMCRPATVDGMARVIAAQQLVAAVQPDLLYTGESITMDDASLQKE